MSEIIWEEPPPAIAGARATRAFAEYADTLRQNPGRWALWPRPTTAASARTFVSEINKGRRLHFEEGFEAQSSQGRLYVRFIGGES